MYAVMHDTIATPTLNDPSFFNIEFLSWRTQLALQTASNTQQNHTLVKHALEHDSSTIHGTKTRD